jgi:hypothetical protein
MPWPASEASFKFNVCLRLLLSSSPPHNIPHHFIILNYEYSKTIDYSSI